MDFVQRTYGEVMVVHSVTNFANITNAQQMREYLFHHIQNGIIKFIFDCTNIEFVDSTFLGALVVVYRNIFPKGGKIALYGVNESVALTLGLTKLNETFKIYPTMDDALKNI